MRTLTICLFFLWNSAFGQVYDYIDEIQPHQKIVPEESKLEGYTLDQNGKAYFEGPQVVSSESNLHFKGYWDLVCVFEETNTILFSSSPNKKNQTVEIVISRTVPSMIFFAVVQFVSFLMFMKWIQSAKTSKDAVLLVICAGFFNVFWSVTENFLFSYFGVIGVFLSLFVILIIFLFFENKSFEEEKKISVIRLVYFWVFILYSLVLPLCFKAKTPVFFVPTFFGLCIGWYWGKRTLEKKQEPIT